MADPQGLFTFPGLEGYDSGTYTALHGEQPGIAVIETRINSSPASIGDIEVYYGSEYWKIRDCKLIDFNSDFDDQGILYRWTLHDRRWRWQFTEITGHYNRRTKNNKLIAYSERTPQQLATLCLRAMGEQGFDVSRLPNTTKPEVVWVASNAAQELSKLCASLGCRLVFDPASDRTSIHRTGVGAKLPIRADLDQASEAFVEPARPSQIRIVYGETRVQAQVKLKAVGREKTDPDAIDSSGEIKAIDDLSYKPTNGWGLESMLFPSLTGEELALANEWIYRAYRLDPESDPIKINIDRFSFTVDRLEQIEDISLELNSGFKDPNGFPFSETAHVDGTYYIRNLGKPINSNETEDDDDERCPFDFSLDAENKLIKFSEQVVKYDDSSGGGAWSPAEIWLTCTFKIRDTRNNQGIHRAHYLHKTQSSGGFGTSVIKRDELKYTIIDAGSSGGDKFNIGNWQSNLVQDKLEEQGRFYAEQAALKYVANGSGDARYFSLFAPRLDGAIQSVTWSFGENGAETILNRNSEPDYVETKYNERIKISEIKRKAGVV